MVRLGIRLEFGQKYETAAVALNGLDGGVRNSAIPNYVHQWTEREIENAVRAAYPRGNPPSATSTPSGFPRTDWTPWLAVQRRLVRYGLPALKGMSRVMPKQTNGFAFAIGKPTPATLRLWLRTASGAVEPDPAWFTREYDLDS